MIRPLFCFWLFVLLLFVIFGLAVWLGPLLLLVVPAYVLVLILGRGPVYLTDKKADAIGDLMETAGSLIDQSVPWPETSPQPSHYLVPKALLDGLRDNLTEAQS